MNSAMFYFVRRSICFSAILLAVVKLGDAGPTTAKPIQCPADIVVRTKTAMELCDTAAGLMEGPEGSVQILELERSRRQAPAAADEAAEERDPETVMCIFGKLKAVYPQLNTVEKSCAPPAAPQAKGPTTTSATANKGKQDEDIRLATCIEEKMKIICH